MNRELLEEKLKEESKVTDLLEPVGIPVRTLKKTVIPPKSEMIFPVYIPCLLDEENILCEPLAMLSDSQNILGSRCVVSAPKGLANYRVLNPTDNEIILNKGQQVAFSYNIDKSQISQIPERERQGKTEKKQGLSREEVTKIVKELGITFDNKEITNNQREQLELLIAENRDCFAVSMEEMGKCDILEHDIDVGNSKPVRQRFYRTNPEMRAEIHRQVSDLVKHGICEPNYSSAWGLPLF